jgi:hypothetical protein
MCDDDFGHSNGAQTEDVQEEDYFFKPEKLIRNLTKELQASRSQSP